MQEVPHGGPEGHWLRPLGIHPTSKLPTRTQIAGVLQGMPCPPPTHAQTRRRHLKKRGVWHLKHTPAGCTCQPTTPYTSPAECHWGWTKPTSTAPLMQLQGNSGMKSMPHVPVVCSGYYRPTTPRPPLQYALCSLSHMQRGTKRVAGICMWRPRTPATATILF